MTDEERAEHDSNYQSLLALYIALINNWNTEYREEALFELASLRTDIAFKAVVKGLKVDMDYALQLLKTSEDNTVSQYDKDLRERLIAAIFNLIDFSVCEEYQLYDEVWEEFGDEIDIDFNSPEFEEIKEYCRKYNDTYSAVENWDIEWAGVMAALWISWSASDWIVYWTQNDNKVRPWHMELQGYAAPRDEFPSWMIPPIEYNCRCFLERLDMRSAMGKSNNIKNIKGALKDIQKPAEISDIYSESLATCGRIFGKSHPYFAVKEKDKDMLKGFVERLRERYCG